MWLQSCDTRQNHNPRAAQSRLTPAAVSAGGRRDCRVTRTEGPPPLPLATGLQPQHTARSLWDTTARRHGRLYGVFAPCHFGCLAACRLAAAGPSPSRRQCPSWEARPKLYGEASTKARPRGPPPAKAQPLPVGDPKPARPAKPVEHALPQLAYYPPLHTVWLGQIYEACSTASSVAV